MKRPKAGTVRQAGISPSTLIAHLQKIASPPAFLHEPSPPLASVNNLSILEELKCAICANVLSQPLELMCSALVCTTCLTESIAASGAVSCPCCSNDGPLLPTHDRPASNAILLRYQMLEDIVLVATGTLEVVIMKGMSVYDHLHLRRRIKLLSY